MIISQILSCIQYTLILFTIFYEDILKAFVQKNAPILEFGGSNIKAFNYFLLINLNGMLFLNRFLMLQNSCVLVFITFCQNFFFFIILTHGLNNLHQINMYNVDANITHRTYLLVKEYLYREI